jgi:hypothetical protein
MVDRCGKAALIGLYLVQKDIHEEDIVLFDTRLGFGTNYLRPIGGQSRQWN